MGYVEENVTSTLDSPNGNSYTIICQKLINLDDTGNKTMDYIPNDTYITPQRLIDKGAPDNLSKVLRMVGKDNITIRYYAQVVGNLGGMCDCSWPMQMKGAYDDDQSNAQIRYTTIYSTPKDGDPESIRTDWILLDSVNDYIIMNNARVKTEDPGCGEICVDEPDFSDTYVNVKVKVTINMTNYCTTPDTENIHNDICYNYMSNWLIDNTASTQMGQYFNNYCENKFPNSELDIFYTPGAMDEKDYNICACNFSQQNYDDFKTSVLQTQPGLSVVSAQCIFTPCKNSLFKPPQLNGCPAPACLNVTNISGNTIEGGDINVSQDCASYVNTSNNVDESGTPIDTTTTTTSVPNPDSTTNTDSMSSWVWFVIGLVVLLLIGLVIFVIYMISRRNKKSSKKVTTSSTTKKFSKFLNKLDNY